jgi:hypothetical protein
MRIQLILALLALGAAGTVAAGEGGYQRWRHSPAPGWGGHGNSHHWGGGHRAPQTVVANSFQRPYPYHLDYYRVRYGGSYAPYFGNMYGVPQVVAPVYGYPPGPYGFPYGGFDYGNGGAQFAPQGFAPPAPSP